MRQLRDLEAQSITILRDAYDNLDLALAWSKDMESTVLLWLARKAFNGQVPIPLIQMDLEYHKPEWAEFQDRLHREWRLGQVVRQTNPTLAVCADSTHGLDTRWDISKIEMLEKAMRSHCWTAVILDTCAARGDTPTRTHHFSLCRASSEWDLRGQQPEVWDPHRRSIPDDSYVCVQPLLDWTESDIRAYMEREHIPVPKPSLNQDHLLRLRSLAWIPPVTTRQPFVWPTP